MSAPSATVIRPFSTGDIGLVASRQAILYAETQGWGLGLEANVLQTCATFLQNFKPGREQCWIAEYRDQFAGAIFLTDEGGGLSRLRLLHVEPAAQGHGIGTMLVSTCLNFARASGYTEMTLWTHTVLAPARRLYAAHGFRLVKTETHNEFGVPVQGETWQIHLQDKHPGTREIEE